MSNEQKIVPQPPAESNAPTVAPPQSDIPIEEAAVETKGTAESGPELNKLTDLLPPGFDPTSQVRKTPLRESAGFKMTIYLGLGLICIVAAGIGFTSMTSVKVKSLRDRQTASTQQSFDDPLVAPPDNAAATKEDVAVAEQRALNQAALESLSEEGKEKAEQDRLEQRASVRGHRSLPPRLGPSRPPSSAIAKSPISIPPRRVPPLRRPSPYRPPASPSRPVVAARPPIPSAPATPVYSPPPHPPIPEQRERNPVSGGEYPGFDEETTPTADTERATLVSYAEQLEDPAPPEEPNLLSLQQDALMAGQSLLEIPSNASLKGKISTQAIARDSATFKLQLTQGTDELPAGTKVLGQVTDLTQSGQFSAQVVALKIPGRKAVEVTPGAISITKPNGDLLKATNGKKSGGFFKSPVVRFVGGLAERWGKGWIDKQLGSNSVLSSRDLDRIIVLDGNRSQSQPRSSTNSKPVIIPKSTVTLNVEQPIYITE